MTARPRPELGVAPAGMTTADGELLAEARVLLDGRYVAGVHEVATAFRLADGAVVRGLHVEASASRASICAESAALSAALVLGSPVVAIVSVLRRPGGTLHLIEPCGVCAELLRDHAPEAKVWVGVDEGFTRIGVRDLLPFARDRSARLGGSPTASGDDTSKDSSC